MLELKYKCNRCGHNWIPEVDNPVTCPRCKAYDWRDAPKWVDGMSIKPNRKKKSC